MGVREFLALSGSRNLVASKTRDIPSAAQIKQTLTQTNAKETQMDMNNKWKHYCTSVHHEIQLLQLFQSLQGNCTSNYWKYDT